VARRNERRRSFDRDLHKRLAKRIKLDGLDPLSGGPGVPQGMTTRSSNLRPTDFAGRPAEGRRAHAPALPRERPETSPTAPEEETSTRTVDVKPRMDVHEQSDGPPTRSACDSPGAPPPTLSSSTIKLGDSLASRALKRVRKRGR